jgi:hypothetical protein
MSMTELHQFFNHGADTHMGVFYPNGYLIAVFSDLNCAHESEKELRDSGLFGTQEVVCASGEEVILHDQEHYAGPVHAMMTHLSRMFGTEAQWADRDVQMAREGCALVAVHCPTQKKKRDAWEHLKQRGPLAARYYSLGLGGIEHLAGDF